MFDEIKEFTIFFKNGNIMKINAYNFYWFDDSIDFYLTKENYENEIDACATFMPQYIYAVADSKFIEYDKNSLFPVEDIFAANKKNIQDLIGQYNESFVDSIIANRKNNI